MGGASSGADTGLSRGCAEQAQRRIGTREARSDLTRHGIRSKLRLQRIQVFRKT
jgi:hypothetical protein